LNKVGGVDIVFNNAGVGEGDYFENYSLEDWDWIIGVNQKGVINGCHFFVPTLKKQQNGMIVNIASAAGYANLPKMSPYNVTKASVIALSESLYGELKPYHVKVIAVTPTFFQSNILNSSRSSSEQIKASAKKVVDTAKMDSKEAALLILQKLPNAKRQIRFPFSAQMIFYVKKWFPTLYWWAIIKKLSK
jgi:NADP-dependent 3-hydroxy acid dehydrogenase YdfG